MTSSSTRRAICWRSATTSANSRRDASYYDLLASEARLSSFVAIAQGQLPQESWFALGRLLTNAGGEPTLLSWSGSMFEYLMPLLVMPTYDNTLLDETYKAAVHGQIEYGKRRGVPWGISESGYNTTDVHLNYQYRAFGVPGLGLKRGLADDLVIAPYASALALMVAPEEACLNLQRLAAEGAEGKYGFYEAIDYTPSRLPRGKSSAVVRSFMAHHQGMSFLSLAYLLLDRPMQKRFESDPLFQATILLLQERVPKATAFYTHAAESSGVRTTRRSARKPRCACSQSPNTPIPEVQLLSNGRYHVMVTNAGGGYSRWKDIAVTRWREDTTCDNWGTFCFIRDVASGQFWSTAYQPTREPRKNTKRSSRRREPSSAAATHDLRDPYRDRRFARRRHRTAPHHHHQPLPDAQSHRGHQLLRRWFWRLSAADALHPAFSNLFVQTEILRKQRAILCTRRPRSHDEHAPWMFHLMAVHGADIGEVSYETDRMQFIGRGNTIADPQAMSGSTPLSGSEGSVLDPIVAIRHRVTLGPGETATINIVTGMGDTPRSVPGLGRQIPGSASRRPGVRSGLDPQRRVPAAAQCHRGGRATVCAPGEFHPLRQFLAARRSQRADQKPPRAIGFVGLFHFRRFADRAAADRRLRQDRSGAPTRAGACLLATERPGRGPGDLERRSRRLPARTP